MKQNYKGWALTKKEKNTGTTGKSEEQKIGGYKNGENALQMGAFHGRNGWSFRLDIPDRQYAP